MDVILTSCLFVEGEFLFYIHLLGKKMVEKSFGHLRALEII